MRRTDRNMFTLLALMVLVFAWLGSRIIPGLLQLTILPKLFGGVIGATAVIVYFLLAIWTMEKVPVVIIGMLPEKMSDIPCITLVVGARIWGTIKKLPNIFQIVALLVYFLLAIPMRLIMILEILLRVFLRWALSKD